MKLIIPKYAYVCCDCNGTNIDCHAHATWDIEQQKWILSDVSKDFYCQSCEAPCNVTKMVVVP